MNYANSTDSKTVLILGGSGVAEGKVTVNAMGGESGWRAGGEQKMVEAQEFLNCVNFGNLHKLQGLSRIELNNY